MLNADHMGGISSLRTAEQDARGRLFPLCYEELGVPTIAKEEAFDPAECGDDDLWPCAGVSVRVSYRICISSMTYCKCAQHGLKCQSHPPSYHAHVLMLQVPAVLREAPVLRWGETLQKVRPKQSGWFW